jgi:glutamate/tyrosine decarboxylase-like PLP-dependent enzyme
MVRLVSDTPGQIAMPQDSAGPPPSGSVQDWQNLDPQDWDEFRRAGHRALDEMIDHLASVRDRPVWQQAPPEVMQHFRQPMPLMPQDLRAVLDDFAGFIRPYGNGNGHPLFLGWVHGAGTPVGMIAEMLAAGLNMNCGGRNHIGIEVERQITSWSAQMLGFPPEASGLFVTGTSVANLVALLAARTAALGEGARDRGLRDADAQLTAYASSEAHGCIARAAEIAGIGSRYLRLVPVDSRGAMRVDLLAEAVAADRAQGLRPFMVVGTAGTANTGAVDDLDAVASFCAEQRLWFHVDGAFGALCALAPSLRPLITGIERADSVAFDFHKWAHVPYDAGFVLLRDPQLHCRAFVNRAAYLNRAAGGLAAGEVWPCDLGPDLSRGFRALKTWFTFQVFGAEKIGACIEQTCRLAGYLAARLAGSDLFEVCAPVILNIVCFTLRAPGNGRLNQAIAIDLHDRGLAAPSTTVLDGRTVIRAAIVNHRTTEADMDDFIDALQVSALRVLGHDQAGSGSSPQSRARVRAAS